MATTEHPHTAPATTPPTDAEIEEIARFTAEAMGLPWDSAASREVMVAITKAATTGTTAQINSAALALMRRAAAYQPSERAITRSSLAVALKAQEVTANEAAEFFEDALHQAQKAHVEYVTRDVGPMTFRLEPEDAFKRGVEHGYQNGAVEMRERAAMAAEEAEAEMRKAAPAIRAIPLTPDAASAGTEVKP